MRFSFPTFSLKLHCRSSFYLHRYATTHVSPTKPHSLNLTFDDSRLLQCLAQNRLSDARRVLDQIFHRDRHSRVVHFTSLLAKYSRLGSIDEARKLFEIMPERNVVTYNAMLSGYVRWGRLSEGLRLFREMPERNVVSWTTVLCGLMGAGRVEEAVRLFDAMPERNVVAWNALVAGLVRNGDLEGARFVFDEMPERNVVSWNGLIAGYCERCMMEEARVLFNGMDDRNVVTWTSMVSGYCRSGNVDEGYAFFRAMPERNVVTWTAMVGGFAWNGFYEKALLLFLEWGKSSDVEPNGETFVSLAYACAGVGLPSLGKQLHCQVIVNGLDKEDCDERLAKGLIYMYCQFGCMKFADFIFGSSLNSFSIQSCNHLINGYFNIGEVERAESFFYMLPIRDEVSYSSMISGYLSFGEVAKACDLFRNMPEKDKVTWTVMVSGLVQNELFFEAANAFSEMRARGVSPLNFTFSSLIGAMGAMAYLDPGRQLHCLVIKTQFKFDVFLNNALISMYSKCGEISNAYSIFSDMDFRDVISWNSMIVGFSNHGLADKALKTFVSMVESGTLPNSVTFLGILSACSHCGLLSEGWEFFNSMSNVYTIQPGLEHYICMIDLLGRAGKVKEAYELVMRLPFEPGQAVWGVLLGICALGETNTNTNIARHAAQRLLELDPLNAPAHVALCNIYAKNNKHLRERMVRREMGLKGVRKAPGCSWISVKGRARVFLSREKVEQEVDEMLLLLSISCEFKN